MREEPSYRPYHKAWMDKEMEVHEIHGTTNGSYDKLRWYYYAVKETNPKSFAEFESDSMTNKFKKNSFVFILF